MFHKHPPTISYVHTPYSHYGHHFSTFFSLIENLALLVSFKVKYSFEFYNLKGSLKGQLQSNKRILKLRPFWNKVYGHDCWRMLSRNLEAP